MVQPGLREATATMLRDQLGDTALVRFRGRRREGQGDFTQPEIEQAVAASRLAIIFAPRCCPAQYQIVRASWRARVWQYIEISEVGVSSKKTSIIWNVYIEKDH